mmetsp:Transcript_25978/g.62376  ORF Transcript_25978/g.62376 Transcript_25978/m.62376 type:complete len:114 (-) Transcript_25978:124-465(-)
MAMALSLRRARATSCSSRFPRPTMRSEMGTSCAASSTSRNDDAGAVAGMQWTTCSMIVGVAFAVVRDGGNERVSNNEEDFEEMMILAHRQQQQHDGSFAMTTLMCSERRPHHE